MTSIKLPGVLYAIDLDEPIEKIDKQPVVKCECGAIWGECIHEYWCLHCKAGFAIPLDRNWEDFRCPYCKKHPGDK